MEEEWREVVGLEGWYEISSLGKPRSLDKTVPTKGGATRLVSGCDMKAELSIHGYLRVAMSKTGEKRRKYSVHRLVAEAFIPNPKNLPVVNHLNGIKTDNRVENLIWDTRRGNSLHAIRTGLQKIRRGTECNSKLTEEDVLSIVDLIKSGCKLDYISGLFNVTKSAIGAIERGKSWSHLTGIKRRIKVVNWLSDEDVINILNLIKNGIRTKTIAKQYNVSKSAIDSIKDGRRWSNLTGIQYNPKKKDDNKITL